MKPINQFLITIFFLFTAITISAQQYDDVNDFVFNVVNESDNVPEAQITEYNGTNTIVRIPPKFNDMPINSIAEGAFAGKGLIDVTIPNGIRNIDVGAFTDNNITKITIGAKVIMGDSKSNTDRKSVV